MAQASSYTKFSTLTAEQQEAFKASATILAQGKTSQNGATTDINMTLEEIAPSGGGGGGSSGKTKISIDVSNSEYVSVSGDTVNITIPANNSYVLLSNLPDSYDKDLEFIIPSVAENEVVDVVIEGCGRARNDVYVKNSQNQYLHKICEDDTGGKSNIEIDTYFQVLVLGEYSYRFFVERPLS